MKYLVCCLLLAGASRDGVGQEALPTPGELLPRLYDYAERYRAALPSLTCDESIDSQEVSKGRMKQQVRIEGTLRETRVAGKTSPFSEEHHILLVDGKPPGPHIKYPFFVRGGFANAIGFARRDQIQCYDYAVHGGQDGKVQLDLTGRPERAGCDTIPEDYRKSVVLEPDSGRVAHVERTISARAAKKGNETFFASFDYGPQQIGDETMWLPVAMSSHDPSNERRMEVKYGNYHRFTGSAKFLPATTKEPE